MDTLHISPPMGFLGPERDGMLAQLGVKINERDMSTGS